MDTYQSYLDTLKEYGVVTNVHNHMVNVDGLPSVRIGELVLFETGEWGYVFRIERGIVRILLFSQTHIRVGTKLVRTGKTISIPVGPELKGCVIDPLGRIILPTPTYRKPKVVREAVLEQIALLDRRVRISKPFFTGVTMVDFMVPLGKGQKQVIVGDRKVGKSSFFFTTVKTQVKENPSQVIIYALIGKSKSDVKQLIEKYRSANLSSQVIFVVSTSEDSPSLIAFTPTTAMVIAQYFKSEGVDSVVILDDLTTHAKYYREIMLTGGEFPGRDSYPGDTFFVHARLLEASGNYRSKDNKEVSITCFPVVETIEGDLTGYICTNIMSMTDGHVFYDSNAYFNGRRPAIEPLLSVTRVGKQAQSSLKREINHEVSVFLSEYERSLNYSHFGAELSQKIKDIIKKGDLLYKFFDQNYAELFPEAVQFVLFALIWLNITDKIPNVNIARCKQLLSSAFVAEQSRQLFDLSLNAKTMYELLTRVSQNEQEFLTICKV
jgi:F-type H+-transporting ATPase subunit alpha